MSEQTTIHDTLCVHSEDYSQSSTTGCLERYPSISINDNFRCYQYEAQEQSPGAVKSENAHHHPMLLVRLMELLSALFPRTNEGVHHGKTSPGSIPTVMYKSNGFSAQPMVWKPGGHYPESDK